jgi:hypothetical protein
MWNPAYCEYIRLRDRNTLVIRVGKRAGLKSVIKCQRNTEGLDANTCLNTVSATESDNKNVVFPRL